MKNNQEKQKKTPYLVVEHDSGLIPSQEKCLVKAAKKGRSRGIDIPVLFAGVDEAANKRG